MIYIDKGNLIFYPLLAQKQSSGLLNRGSGWQNAQGGHRPIPQWLEEPPYKRPMVVQFYLGRPLFGHVIQRLEYAPDKSETNVRLIP